MEVLPRQGKAKVVHYQAIIIWNVKENYEREKEDKTMNIKMAANSQLSTTESKKQKQTKQTTRIETESQKWRSCGGLSVGKGMGENGGKGAGSKKHKLVGTE